MKKNIVHIIYFIAVMWGVFFLSHVIPLNRFGITPRSLTGLPGILFSPFLHGNFNHIISNTTALLIFAPIFSLIESKDFISKIFFLIIFSGIITWVIGGPGVHIGASGLIFSLYGFLVSLAYFNRKFLYIALSLLISAFYGYMIFGVFPLQDGVSWEGHLGGFVSGIIYAKLAKK